MSVEEESARAPTPKSDPVVSAGIEIAMKWGAALGGPEKLHIAFQALEPQLKREHQIRLKQIDMQREKTEREAEVVRSEAERRARDVELRRHHTYRMAGLVAGVVISLALLGAGVGVAADQPWLATLLCGPSLLALAKIFVLRRSDSGDTKAISRGARDAAGAAAPPPPSVL